MRRAPVLALIALLGSGPALAQAPLGYLAPKGVGIDYASPAAPAPGSVIAQQDLDAVRLFVADDAARHTQAFEDASAYGYAQLLPRFSEAAGTHLDTAATPILAYVLRRALADVTTYVNAAKNANPRPRPYVEDASITPCETDYLRPTDNASYPSGHSANGYTAAQLIAQVMPERRAPVMLRGVRYGYNRVVCGVHHPIDVMEGERISAAYFAKLMGDDRFKQDLACAREERALSVAAAKSAIKALSQPCEALRKVAVEEAGK